MIRKKYSKDKLEKISCEICQYSKKEALHLHHIIPRCDPRSSNDLHNLACLCPNCHDLVHAGVLIIVGVFKTTAGRKLMWFKDGDPPPLEKEFWLVKDNPLVLRSNKKLNS